MKYLVKPRHIYKYFYSTSDDKHSRKGKQDEPEPYTLLSDQEIEFEVKFRIFLLKIKVQHVIIPF